MQTPRARRHPPASQGGGRAAEGTRRWTQGRAGSLRSVSASFLLAAPSSVRCSGKWECQWPPSFHGQKGSPGRRRCPGKQPAPPEPVGGGGASPFSSRGEPSPSASTVITARAVALAMTQSKASSQTGSEQSLQGPDILARPSLLSPLPLSAWSPEALESRDF